MGVAERTNVIVVGAGASQEFGLPTGAELTKKIQLDLAFGEDGRGHIRGRNGDYDLRHAIELFCRETSENYQDCLEPARQISRNMQLAPSIDNYLDTHKDKKTLVNVGKLAIANAIIKAEKRSSLFVDPSNIYNRLAFDQCAETWAAVFFKIIVAKRDYQSFLRAIGNITFISFNYDRCIKQFFANASTTYFQLNDQQALEVFAEIKVIHPYGDIGELNVQNSRIEGFGLDANAAQIYSASQRIRTFTEGVSDKNLLASIKKPLEMSEVTIFLGFSFIDINMQILKPNTAVANRVLATAKGRSEDTKRALHHELRQTFTKVGPLPAPRFGRGVSYRVGFL